MTKVTVVMHAAERERTSNTARILELMLNNSEVQIIGKKDHTSDLSRIADPRYQPLMLFLEPSAPDLTPEFAAEFNKPIHLIVPDGTWSQARKIAHRQSELLHVQRVKLPSHAPSRYALRRKRHVDGLCTIEAAALALGILEGPEIEEQLITLYERMMGRILWSRATSSPFTADKESFLIELIAQKGAKQ